MPDPDALEALAARCEAAEALQPDGGWKLDSDIARVLGWTYQQRDGVGHWQWHHPTNQQHIQVGPPAFSTSLDAAITLVPEGWQKSIWISDSDNGADALCELCSNEFEDVQVRARSWPLAICAASLRALASNGGGGAE